jgi:SAM-dependent methyltransferase
MDRIDAMPQWQVMDFGFECQTEPKPVLHLGPGRKGGQDGTIDIEWPDYDFDQVGCLSRPGPDNPQISRKMWAIEDESCAGVVATHVLEHLRDPRHLIWEVDRVLVPGGVFNIVVPKAGTNLFWQDLDHKSGFVLDTWKTLLDNSYYLKGKNVVSRLQVGFNAEMSIKEGNTVIVTQLIKTPLPGSAHRADEMDELDKLRANRGKSPTAGA